MGTRNEILKYTLLPGIIPRFIALFRSGFSHMAYMMAIIYSNVRLLPAQHPYLMPQNIGRFGIRHVIAEAANQLKFKRQNIDQIVIFFTILVGLMLLLLQFILLIAAIIAEQPAYALSVAEMFDNPNDTTGSQGPAQDIAFIVLDRVFGIGDGTSNNNMFNSCIANLAQICTDMENNPLPTPTAFPFPFHLALHNMLRFYSYGIFMVGVFVIIYFAITIAAETAQTGTPFGQRFNKAWAPVRFIIFFALIIPLESATVRTAGLNAAQLITFKVTQLGSNMATNGWSYFNGAGTGTATTSANYLTQQQDIVAIGKIPEINDLIQSIYVARTCAAAYHIAYGEADTDIDAYIVRSTPPANMPAPPAGLAGTPNAQNLLDYQAAVNFVYGGNIVVRFGTLAPTPIPREFIAHKGNVKPYCGEVTLQLSGFGEPGANEIYKAYYDLIVGLWSDDEIIAQTKCIAQEHIRNNNECEETNALDQDAAIAKITQHTNSLRADIQNGINIQRASGAFDIPPELIERGWAGAAIWYNRIAAMNGAVTTATLGIPKFSRIPLLMDVAFKSNTQQNKSVTSENLFNQDMADALGINVLLEITDTERRMLNAMRKTYNFWASSGGAQLSNFVRPTGNIMIDFINTVLGTSGIFEMRQNTDVHPLAQLTALGKGLMEATVRNAAFGIVLGGSSSLGFKLEFAQTSAEAGKAAASFFMAMVLASAAISMVLYYVLPFLPFIYFMFALSGWIKSIFEAIVAMPLWALAHLRIDGEGLPGPGASNGYFLLLEIFLRPILIVIGLIASITIFAALVNVLNEIFDLVVANVGGYDNELEANIATGAAAGIASQLSVSKGPLDEFFYTAMYAIICYLIGLASFKLVDLIPNNILRWMGVSVTTFQEKAEDPAGKLSQQVYRGTQLTANQVSGQVKGDLALLSAGA